ncbi:hypothetical protein A5741_05500 [Mycolicibacterium conceptionense]|nr:hypothetical protein A5741_05500 [Mycolicibacterium conceptionense]
MYSEDGSVECAGFLPNAFVVLNTVTNLDRANVRALAGRVTVDRMRVGFVATSDALAVGGVCVHVELLQMELPGGQSGRWVGWLAGSVRPHGVYVAGRVYPEPDQFVGGNLPCCTVAAYRQEPAEPIVLNPLDDTGDVAIKVNCWQG